jgi:hypothetical protein
VARLPLLLSPDRWDIAVTGCGCTTASQERYVIGAGAGRTAAPRTTATAAAAAPVVVVVVVVVASVDCYGDYGDDAAA